MGWFSKKENKTEIETLPELPELPESPHTDSIFHESFEPPNQQQLPQLPSFQPPSGEIPKTNLQKNFNIEPVDKIKAGMQKSRFDLDSPPEYPVQNFGISKPLTEEYKPYQPPSLSPPKTLGIAPGSFKPSVREMSKKEPVYIRLDKFSATMEALRDIKNKIREIEEILAKTKEIKEKEEKEIEEWEREIESIKLKLDSIDKEISSEE